MKDMKHSLRFLCVVGGMILAVLVGACAEYKTQFFVNLKDPDNNQLSWVPEFLLKDGKIKDQVFDFYESHDLDTNETWGTFSAQNENCILEKAIAFNEDKILNQKKMERRLRKLGYRGNFEGAKIISGDNALHCLFWDEKEKKFYFYGKYK